ncbi:ABC transporter permease [Hydromonas duriensis]|uniref:Arginine/ornithine transport system permease protein n=1 Tax=Hydromonas duriensis TaxID=1527608 RepID=A0A4R6Y8J4_9BURK|nr:ABC transporter permease subunit [Hydromonas duriensis]TDR31712.1 arginine/ornithine transport system permease protein [Hydromonas duriensis]
MKFDAFSIFWHTFVQCVVEGLPLTLLLTASSVLAGLVLAIPLSVVHARRSTPIAKSVRFFVYFFTGTPLLVQMYLFYKGFPEFDWVQALMEKPAFDFLKEGFFWVWLALTLNTTAYLIEIFSGAIRNTDNGEVEAGRAYGLTRAQVTRHIILPSALRRALPAYSNEVIMMLQATALASSFTLYEVMGQAVILNSETYRPFPVFIAAAAVYLLLTFGLVYLFKIAEKRYLNHLKPQAH